MVQFPVSPEVQAAEGDCSGENTVSERDIIRYISHEMRTPVHILHANLSFLDSDFTGGTHSTSKNGVAAKVKDAFNAVSSITLILKDIVLYDQILAEEFQISGEYLQPKPLLSWLPTLLIILKI